MKKILLIIFTILLSLNAQALFEVKDASDHSVFEITDDGIRIFNYPDTLMIISSDEIRANLDNSTKGLSRSFSISTSATGKGTLARVLEVGTQSTIMREGGLGNQYTNFSPENIFIGLNAGIATQPDTTLAQGINNVFLGNNSGKSNDLGISNVFIGKDAGSSNIGNGEFLNGEKNVFIGQSAGFANISGACNVFLGKDAGKLNEAGLHNICVGTQAGWANVTGGQNTYIGGLSAFNCSGSDNVFLGYLSGMHATGSGNVLIGKSAGENTTRSNILYIENSSTNSPLIYGEFDNDSLQINGNFNVTGTLTTTGTANLNGVQTWVNHDSGTANGLFIKNKLATNPWHFYEYSTGNLLLYYDTSLRGTFSSTTGAYTSSSDKRFKKNIEEFTNVLDKLMLLSPKRYNFISQKNSEQKYIGFIAQDVKELFPAFVQYNEEDDKYTMDYAGLSVVAIQAIKEQQKEIDNLKSEIEQIKKILNK